MELSNVVVAVEEAAEQAHEVGVVEPLPLPPLVREEAVAVAVKDLEEARRLVNLESPKLHEPSWSERSRIEKKWHHWQRSQAHTQLLAEGVSLTGIMSQRCSMDCST